MKRRARWGTVGVPVLLVAVLATGCSATSDQGDATADSTPSSPAPTQPVSSTPEPTPTPSPTPTTRSPSTGPSTGPNTGPSTGPARFDAAAALRDVRTLAGEIGPRLATAPAFRAAARVVQRRFEGHGYDVRRQPFPVPAGDSWGVPVRAGRSFNLIATPPGFDPAAPHLIVGAHLDTVAVSPGAEDNASGIAVLLELARLASTEPTRLPAVLVAFGAEEPRGEADNQHHFGSQHYVREMPPAQRAALRTMVAIDRVGVGAHVPVCTGPLSPHRVRDQILRVAQRRQVPAEPCELTTSDHWSFEKAGHTVARLGGAIDYAAYHSERDLPRVVSRRQLERTGRLAWAWLSR